jgi:hypothetical protein
MKHQEIDKINRSLEGIIASREERVQEQRTEGQISKRSLRVIAAGLALGGCMLGSLVMGYGYIGVRALATQFESQATMVYEKPTDPADSADNLKQLTPTPLAVETPAQGISPTETAPSYLPAATATPTAPPAVTLSPAQTPAAIPVPTATATPEASPDVITKETEAGYDFCENLEVRLAGYRFDGKEENANMSDYDIMREVLIKRIKQDVGLGEQEYKIGFVGQCGLSK